MRSKRALGNLVALAVALAACLGTAEWILRLRFGPPVVFRFPQEAYEPDQEIGHRLSARQRSFTHDQPVETNAHGLRDRDFPARKPYGSRRLLALGDSQTFGNGLALPDTWPKQLERLLAREDAETRWEVINAGIEAMDTWQHERILERVVDLYEVDGVVLAFYVNDVAVAPATVVPAEGRTNTASKRIAYLLKRSALVTSLLRLGVPGRRAEADRERRVITGGYEPVIERGWQQVESSLAGMRSRTRAMNIGLLIAVLPRRDQVDGSQSAIAYNARIARIAGRLGIPIVDLLEPLRRAWSEHGEALFIPWDGHNSAVANRIIARELVGPARALAPASQASDANR